MSLYDFSSVPSQLYERHLNLGVRLDDIEILISNELFIVPKIRQQMRYDTLSWEKFETCGQTSSTSQLVDREVYCLHVSCK